MNCVKERYLLPNIEKTLNINSILLSKLVENIELEFKDIVMVEIKHTSDRKHLAGITIDYRHLNDWMLYKNKLEPSLDEIIQKYRSPYQNLIYTSRRIGLILSWMCTQSTAIRVWHWILSQPIS